MTGGSDAQSQIASVPLWYHTLELAPGVETPGWFDLRPIAGRLPWPDVRGKRCLDIGTFDGYLAFELERRGAAEVIATDLTAHEDWDWPPAMRERGPQAMADMAGEKGRGFEVARELLGSSVQRMLVSVYDLDPEEHGQFDVVVCGSLLLHLRDPLRALDRIRAVCRGQLMSSEEIDLPLTLLQPRRAALRFDGLSELFQWTIPNVAAHRRMIRAMGFDPVRSSGPYTVRYGAGHPPRPRTGAELLKKARRHLLAGGDGVPHHALLARVREPAPG